MFSQKWLDAIASQESVQEDLQATCEGVDKVVYCKEQVNRLNSNGQTGLMIQARLGRLLDVQELLAYKADPNIISNDPMRTTALHLACQSVDFADGERIVLRLLASGAKARIKDALGNLPLHDLLGAASAKKKQKITSRMITAHKVDINAQNNDGDTPLHIAVNKNDLDWVNYVVNKFPKKINFTLKNNRGYTPLALAESYGYDQLVDILKQAMKKQQIPALG
jgi:ankyrin repeat protein